MGLGRSIFRFGFRPVQKPSVLGKGAFASAQHPGHFAHGLGRGAEQQLSNSAAARAEKVLSRRPLVPARGGAAYPPVVVVLSPVGHAAGNCRRRLAVRIPASIHVRRRSRIAAAQDSVSRNGRFSVVVGGRRRWRWRRWRKRWRWRRRRREQRRRRWRWRIFERTDLFLQRPESIFASIGAPVDDLQRLFVVDVASAATNQRRRRRQWRRRRRRRFLVQKDSTPAAVLQTAFFLFLPSTHFVFVYVFRHYSANFPFASSPPSPFFFFQIPTATPTTAPINAAAIATSTTPNAPSPPVPSSPPIATTTTTATTAAAALCWDN